MLTRRKLSAIMFTDIVGYTALMQIDEKNAFETKNRHKRIFETTTKNHNGEIIQYFGDGTLSVFNSSVEAVECAIKLQEQLLEDPEIPVRIGIHVGDILFSDNDIVGDAVNIASRIESCGVGGGVVISDKVNDHIKSHSHIKTEYLGAFNLKNIEKPVPIYAISRENLRMPSGDEIAMNLGKSKSNEKDEKKQKIIGNIIMFASVIFLASIFYLYYNKEDKIGPPAIAVLPFDNLSSNPNDVIYGDGLTEEILTSLTRLNALQVISRTSAFQYKNTEKSIPQIAKELDVDYILEGSVRTVGNKIRVTAQLINAEDDVHVWAENYDRTITDIFAIQSEVSKEIVSALELNISREEEATLVNIPTSNIEAYRYFLRGKQEADKRSAEGIERSIDFYSKAIEIDPRFAEAYAEIANSIYLTTYYSGADLDEATQKSKVYLEEAEQLDENLPRVFTVKGLLANHQGEFEKAKNAFEKAIALAPNDITARHQYATYFFYTEQYKKQLEQTKIAYKLDPLSFASASAYVSALIYNKKYKDAEHNLAIIEDKFKDADSKLLNRTKMRLYLSSKEYEKAIAPLLNLSKENPHFYRVLGYTYAKIGNRESSYQIMDSVKKYGPENLISHRLAVIFAGLNEKDSVFYYLDTTRNKSKLFNDERVHYFNPYKKSKAYRELLLQHGIKEQIKVAN